MAVLGSFMEWCLALFILTVYCGAFRDKELYNVVLAGLWNQVEWCIAGSTH